MDKDTNALDTAICATYAKFDDPGHGWLRVPRAECKGIGVSRYSYVRGPWAYLEEDGDMSLFILHMAKRGVNVDWKTDTCNKESPIRSYAPYTED